MYRKFTTLLSPLLLATLALPAFVAPQALAAPPQATAITTHQLFPQTQQYEYTRGFRDGYRQATMMARQTAGWIARGLSPARTHSLASRLTISEDFQRAIRKATNRVTRASAVEADDHSQVCRH